MTKNKAKKTMIAIVIITILAFAVANLGLLSLFTFEFGFSPYGESPNQVTDLQKDIQIETFGNCGSATQGCFDLSRSTSKFWDIERISSSVNRPHGNERSISNFEGNDFKIISIAEGLSTTISFITTEELSDKDFKFTLDCNQVNDGFCLTQISLIGLGIIYEATLPNSKVNFVISPSPISNKVSFFINGVKDKELPLGNYKVKINTIFATGSGTSGGNTEFIIENPSFKQDFGCTKEPNEQFYVTIFNEGDRVNLNKLDNFNKFCLDESPLKVFTNVGSTTDTSVLRGLVNKEEFVVPNGQVWSIEYIGELTTFVTECEANELFNQNENVCMARTVVTLTCASGSDFDFERGICVTETEPILFSRTDIKTHQNLENSGMMRFNHIRESGVDKTNSFMIGDTEFKSKGLTQFGGSFSYGQTFDLVNGKNYKLNDFLNVKTILEGNNEDFKIEYTFTFNVDFLETDYQNNGIIVTNNLGSIDGGITITRLDNLGTTTVETIDTLLMSQTNFDVDINNLIELKARPFVKVESPEFIYRFDVIQGIEVSNFEFPEGVIVKKVSKVAVTFSIIGLIIGILILIFLFRFMRKR